MLEKHLHAFKFKSYTLFLLADFSGAGIFAGKELCSQFVGFGHLGDRSLSMPVNRYALPGHSIASREVNNKYERTTMN